ncbi:alanine racemase [Gammaproteobacteria bacterium]|nr:alanine racemase [Gammaproteobacteria bacterium]
MSDGGLTPTPYVEVNVERIDANIEAMQRRADAAGVTLRPHIKTHKCVEIARRQHAAGAGGFSCATSAEARMLFEHLGAVSVTLCFPQVSARTIVDLLNCAGAGELRLVIDSLPGIAAAVAAARQTSRRLPVYLELDTGLGRCGHHAESEILIDLARQIADHDELIATGLTAHAGHAYSAASLSAIDRIIEQEEAAIERAMERLANQGLRWPNAAVGSTPSCWRQGPEARISEWKPGNYVFNDLNQRALGVVGQTQLALSVIATVVSLNARYMIVDAGSKALSSDRGAHGSSAISGYGVAEAFNQSAAERWSIDKLSEEHGFVAHQGRPLAIGDPVRIWPNHACVVANLTSALQRSDGGHWAVAARR